jgi:hypothetical protein
MDAYSNYIFRASIAPLNWEGQKTTELLMRTIFVLFDSLNRRSLETYGAETIKTPKKSLALAFSFALSLCCALVFEGILNVNLPRGVFGLAISF